MSREDIDAYRARVSRPHPERFRAVVCLKGGRWLTMRGEFTHPGYRGEWGPSPDQGLVEAVVRGKHPDAEHIFIIRTWIPKADAP